MLLGHFWKKQTVLETRSSDFQIQQLRFDLIIKIEHTFVRPTVFWKLSSRWSPQINSHKWLSEKKIYTQSSRYLIATNASFQRFSFLVLYVFNIFTHWSTWLSLNTIKKKLSTFFSFFKTCQKLMTTDRKWRNKWPCQCR